MSKFFNQEKIGVEEHKDYFNVIINIDMPESNNLIEYYESIDKVFMSKIEELNESTNPIMITVIGDFVKFKKQKIEDLNYFILIIKSIICSHIIFKDEPLEREQRLGIPFYFKGTHLTDFTLMSIINKRLKFPNFNIELKDTKGKIIDRVF